MKQKIRFSIQPHPEGNTLLEIRSLESGRWRLVGRQECADGDAASPLLQRMAVPETAAAWLLPNDEVKSFVTAFPRLGRKELQRAVPGWVAREEGGKPADWATVWRPLADGRSGSKSEQEDLYLLYSARECIDRQLAQAAHWGLKPTLMLPPYIVLDQFFRKYGPEADDLEGWNLVFLGHRESFLCISTRESLLLTRPLPVDLSDGADPREYLGRLVTEVDRSVSFARQTEQNPNIERMIVCGDQRRCGDLVELMAKELSMPAIAWNLDDHFEDVDAREAPELRLALLAATLAGDPSVLHLGPRAGRQFLSRRGRRHALVASGALGLALIPLLMVGGWITGRVQDNYLDRARTRMSMVIDQAQAAQDQYWTQRVLLARQMRMNRFLEKNPDYETVLLRIADLTPQQVIYEDLRIREQPDGRIFVELEGAASAGTAAEAQRSFLALRKALDDCDFLSGGEPDQIEILGRNGRDRQMNAAVFAMEYQLLRPEAQRRG